MLKTRTSPFVRYLDPGFHPEVARSRPCLLSDPLDSHFYQNTVSARGSATFVESDRHTILTEL